MLGKRKVHCLPYPLQLLCGPGKYCMCISVFLFVATTVLQPSVWLPRASKKSQCILLWLQDTAAGSTNNSSECELNRGRKMKAKLREGNKDKTYIHIRPRGERKKQKWLRGEMRWDRNAFMHLNNTRSEYYFSQNTVLLICCFLYLSASLWVINLFPVCLF